MRALIPGYVNYYYDKDTHEPPGHTKQAFTNSEILTVYSLILKNIILFMYKLKYRLQNTPKGIVDIFPVDLEILSETRLVTMENTMFVKGRRLFSEVMGEFMDEYPIVIALKSLNSFKNMLKAYFITIQAKGSSDEWVTENFRLCIQLATRKSQRLLNTF